MPIHFSERFDRFFEDEDWLNRHEAAQVLSSNAGHVVYPEYLNVLVQRDELHPNKISARVSLYQYKELRVKVINTKGGRIKQDNPSPNAMRQRKYRERQQIKSKPGYDKP